MDNDEIRKLIDKKVNEFSKHSNKQKKRVEDFNNLRLMVYVVVNGQSPVPNAEYEQCDEISALQNLTESHFVYSNAMYINIPASSGAGTAAFNKLNEIYNYCNEKYSFYISIDSWAVVPIFVQNEKIYDALAEYQLFCELLVKYIENHGKDSIFLPAVLFESNNNEMNTPLIEKLVEHKYSLKKICFPILMIYPQTQYGYLEYESRMKTIMLTSLLMVSLADTLPNMNSKDKQCYTSRVLTICQPHNAEIFIKAKSLLDYFTSDIPEEADSMKKLGVALSAVAYETIWNRWSELACRRNNDNDAAKPYENKEIVFSPVKSILFSSQASPEEKENIIAEFVRHYWLSHLGTDISKEQLDSVVEKIFDKYTDSYKYHINGLINLFGVGERSVLISKYLLELAVAHEQGMESGNIKRLIEETKHRNKQFYDNFFASECYASMQKNYDISRKFIDDLKKIINQKIRYWEGIEGTMTFLEESWSEEQRKKLFDAYISFIKSASEENINVFCNELFGLSSGGIIDDSEGYIKNFHNHVNDANVCSSWKRLTSYNVRNIIAAANSVHQSYVIWDATVGIAKDDIKKIDENIEQYINITGMTDRVELISVSEFGKWQN